MAAPNQELDKVLHAYVQFRAGLLPLREFKEQLGIVDIPDNNNAADEGKQEEIIDMLHRIDETIQQQREELKRLGDQGAESKQQEGSTIKEERKIFQFGNAASVKIKEEPGVKEEQTATQAAKRSRFSEDKLTDVTFPTTAIAAPALAPDPALAERDREIADLRAKLEEKDQLIGALNERLEQQTKIDELMAKIEQIQTSVNTIQGSIGEALINDVAIVATEVKKIADEQVESSKALAAHDMKLDGFIAESKESVDKTKGRTRATHKEIAEIKKSIVEQKEYLEEELTKINTELTSLLARTLPTVPSSTPKRRVDNTPQAQAQAQAEAEAETKTEDDLFIPKKPRHTEEEEYIDEREI